MFFGVPLEVLTVFAGLCISLPDATPISVRKILKWIVIIGLPTTVMIIGAFVVLLAEVRIYRQETSKVAPMPPPSPPPQEKAKGGKGGGEGEGEGEGGGATIAVPAAAIGGGPASVVRIDIANKNDNNNEHLREKPEKI